MVTRSTSFGPTAGTADTEAIVGAAYTFSGSGTIKKIRCVFNQPTVDLGVQGIISLYFKKISGPFEFAVGMIQGKATAGELGIPSEEIDVDISYVLGDQVTVKFNPSETVEDITISLILVE